MRTGLLATVMAVLLVPALASAADPPIVYQTQPVGRVLDEVRAVASLVGGAKAVEAFNGNIKKSLGDKGFDGLDINRPVFGYVDIPADPKATVAVLALPVTGEKEFLDFCERWNKGKPKALKGGLYEVPALNPDLKAVMRVADGYAYIATGAKDPARVLDPKALVPVAKVYDAADPSLVTGRIYFDRFSKELREKALEQLEEAKKAIAAMKLPPDTSDLAKNAFEQFSKFATRYIDLSKGAKEAALRLSIDPATGDAAAEFSLSAVPGSPLAQIIAERKPTTNRFAGLLTPDTAVGSVVQLPLFSEEIRTAAGDGLEALREAAKNKLPQEPKALVDELLKGAVRTVKAGEIDFAYVVRGPDKDGAFSAVVALSFDDPSGVEKELKKLVNAQLLELLKQALKWDAEKANGVSIHTFDFSKAPGLGGEEIKKVFGENPTLAFAFAPKAIYIAMGQDAVGTVKAAMAAKPAECRAFDVILNPARFLKLRDVLGWEAFGMAKGLEKEDKPISFMSLSIVGGSELKVKFTMNVKQFSLSVAGTRNVEPGDQLQFKK